MTVLAYLNLKPFRKRINNGRSDTVQASRNLISASAEFTACVENGKNDRNGRKSLFLVDTNRNASSVISYCNYVVG